MLFKSGYPLPNAKWQTKNKDFEEGRGNETGDGREGRRPQQQEHRKQQAKLKNEDLPT